VRSFGCGFEWAEHIEPRVAAVSIAGEKQVGFTSNFTEGARYVPAVAVDVDRDDHRDRDDAPIPANFKVGDVDPQIGPIALDRSLQENLHLLVDLSAQPADLARLLEMPLIPMARARASTQRVETPRPEGFLKLQTSLLRFASRQSDRTSRPTRLRDCPIAKRSTKTTVKHIGLIGGRTPADFPMKYV
jgi:hypothetical protein